MMHLPHQQVLLAEESLVFVEQRLLVAKRLRPLVLTFLCRHGYRQGVRQTLQEGNITITKLARCVLSPSSTPNG